MTVRGREGAGVAGAKAREASDASAEVVPEERRAQAAPRVPFEALVAVVEGGAGGFEAESVDVSTEGMRLRTATLPSAGDKLVCRFDGMGSEIVVDGEVLWRHEEAKGGEFGVRFVGVDEATSQAIRAMCMTLGDPGDDEAATEADPAVVKGSRVRLHIEGLGSPMKARVRTSAAKELSVGSNLEFLKVGRALELEDVEHGKKREATIDQVKVDIDPATNIPQLVVTLRFDKGARDADPAGTKPAKKARAATAREVDHGARTKPMSRMDGASIDEGEGEIDAKPSQAAAIFGRARGATEAAFSRVGPALAGAGTRAKSALGNMLDFVKQRRTERVEAAKRASAPRRTTSPAPGGGLTAEGKRLVRGAAVEEEDPIEIPTGTRRAAIVGGALGLVVVLAIFGAARFAGRNHPPQAGAQAAAGIAAVAALPTAEPIAAPGTPTANVPLFGATPLSTTEPALGAVAPSASAAAAAGAPPPSGEDDDPPGDKAPSGAVMREWGTGSVTHPVVLKIKMDGPGEGLSGAAGAQGFTITVPGHRSLVTSTASLVKKDKRIESVRVTNTSSGAEITVQFKDGVPPYLAKLKGDRLEIAIGKEGKIAKSKKKKH